MLKLKAILQHICVTIGKHWH